MESWLTFLVRLIVIVFVGVCVWCVLYVSTLNLASDLQHAIRIGMGRSEVKAEQSLAPVKNLDQTQNSRSLIFPTVFVGLLGFSLLGFCEFARFCRFKLAVRAIEKAQAKVHYGSTSIVGFKKFYFGQPTIDLSNTRWKGIEFPDVSAIPRLLALRLCSAEIDAENLKTIGRCRSLISLDLSNTGVDNVEVSELGIMKNLKSLILNNTKVTNGVLGFLLFHPRLQKIEYTGTGITDGEAEKFCDRLS